MHFFLDITSIGVSWTWSTNRHPDHISGRWRSPQSCRDQSRSGRDFKFGIIWSRRSGPISHSSWQSNHSFRITWRRQWVVSDFRFRRCHRQFLDRTRFWPRQPSHAISSAWAGQVPRGSNVPWGSKVPCRTSSSRPKSRIVTCLDRRITRWPIISVCRIGSWSWSQRYFSHQGRRSCNIFRVTCSPWPTRSWRWCDGQGWFFFFMIIYLLDGQPSWQGIFIAAKIGRKGTRSWQWRPWWPLWPWQRWQLVVGRWFIRRDKAGRILHEWWRWMIIPVFPHNTEATRAKFFPLKNKLEF
jgi:hypothetical protein